MTIYLHYQLLIMELLPMIRVLNSFLPFPICTQNVYNFFHNTDLTACTGTLFWQLCSLETQILCLHQQVTRKSTKKREILKVLNINITVQLVNSIFSFDFLYKIGILIMSIRLILKTSKSIIIPNPISFLVNSSVVFNIILSLVFCFPCN